MYLLDAQTAKTYISDMTAWTVSFSSESEEAIIQQDVKEQLLEDWCNCIMASSEEECDALYDVMVENAHDLGLDKLVAAQQEVVSVNMAKLDGSYFNK